MTTPQSQSSLNAYLTFDGRCEEAIQFYQKALGAEVQMVSRFKDSPEPNMCGNVPGDKIMHASLRLGGTVLMMSDGQCSGQANFQGFSLSLSFPSVADVDRAFAALSEGGKVQMPLGEAFFTEKFGMVADRFGVSWMVLVTPKEV